MFDLFYFIAFILIVLIVTISIIYSSLRFGISPMPSSRKAYSAMFQLIDTVSGSEDVSTLSSTIASTHSSTLNLKNNGPIIDLGSGWGNLVLRIAKRYPNKEVIGYEMSILPWLTSVLLKKTFGLNNLTLHRQDFYNVKFPAKSVLVCYLFPEAMAKISTKLLEQSEVHFLISNNFALPGFQLCKTIQLNDFYKSPIYLYKLIPS
jgi:hypothetical protein